MDVSTVTAVTAAAQPAAAPATTDAVFGSFLQNVTDTTPTGAAPVAGTVPPSSNPMPGANDNANVAMTTDMAAELLLNQQAAAVTAALPQNTTPTAVQAGADVTNEPAPANAGQHAPETAQAPTTKRLPSQITMPPQVVSDGADQTAAQPGQANAQQTAQPQSGQSTTKQADVQGQSDQTPVPQPGLSDATGTPPVDPAQASATTPAKATGTDANKPTDPKADEAKQPDQKATDNNSVMSVLAGFLLAQIEPTAVPANDAGDDNDHAVKDATTEGQGTSKQQPETPTTAMVPPPVPPATTATASQPTETDPLQVAAIEAGLKNKINTSPDANSGQASASGDKTTKDTATPQNGATPAAPQDGAKPNDPQNATDHNKETAAQKNATTAPQPDAKPAAQPAPAAQASATPPPAPSAPPAQHAAAAVQNTTPLPPTVQSGLHALSAGLHVATQQHDATATLDKLGVTIATKSVEGIRQFDIRLDPPELGRVDVRLTMDDDGKAHANLVVDKPQTLQLLQRDAPNLNRALSEAGLSMSNNGLNFSLREQYRQNDGGEDKGRGRSLSVKAVVQTDAIAIHSSLGSYAPNSVRLDIRV